MKAVVIDAYSTPGVHERVNTAFFEHVCNNDKINLIHFFGNVPCTRMQKVIFHKLPDIFFTRLPLSFHLILRDIVLPLYIIVILITYARHHKVIIGFSRVHVISLLPFLLPFRCSLLFHSQLELLKLGSKRSLKNLFWWFARVILKLVLDSSRHKKLFLSPHIKTSLERNCVSFSKSYFIYHPVTQSDVANSYRYRSSTSQDLLIGNIGLFREDTKKSNYLYKVARNNRDLSFLLVGREGPGFTFRDDISNLNYVKYSQPVEYSRLVLDARAITHFIFLYLPNTYEYTSSGTLVDAMCLNKGIIINRGSHALEQIGDVNVSFFTERDWVIDCKNLINTENQSRCLKDRILVDGTTSAKIVETWLI